MPKTTTLTATPENCQLLGQPLPPKPKGKRGPRSPYFEADAKACANAVGVLQSKLPRLAMVPGFVPTYAKALRGDLWALASAVGACPLREPGAPTRKGVRLNPVRVPPTTEARLRMFALDRGIGIAEARRQLLATALDAEGYTTAVLA